MRSAYCAIGVLLLAIALGACGESAEEKAQTTVCDARSDMTKQIDELKGLTPSTVTTDGVKQNINAIRADLKDIAGAQADLSDDRRSEVEAATKTFTASVRAIASEVLRSTSAEDAKAGVVTALQQLEASFKSTFAPIDCS